MNSGNSRRAPVLLRSVEDLADAKQLRSAIAAILETAPIDEAALRCAVWSFVGTERRAGVPPALVITRLTGLIDAARIVPMSAQLALTRGVILWCVEEYFGRLGGDVLAGPGTLDTQQTLDDPVDASGPVAIAPVSQ